MAKEKVVVDLGVDMSNMSIDNLGRYCDIAGIQPEIGRAHV